MNKQKVVVVGAGFAGIQFVRKLDEKLFDIILIDKLNHHQFQPLFYQVATSQIEPSSISFPLRNILKGKKNLQIRLGEVTFVHVDKQIVETTIGNFDYDVLVIATGCKTNFFGNTLMEKKSFTLKSTYEAITIRNHILEIFEKIISSNPQEREALQNLVIVGGGPTGIELSGAFAEIKKYVLPKDYPGIDFSNFSIYLIEGSENTLNSMSNMAKKYSKKYLIELGVKVFTQRKVETYDGTTLVLDNGDTLVSKTVIWTAGVTGNPIKGLPKDVLVRANRIEVNRLNEVKGIPNVYALGDIAYMQTPQYPNAHPQVANVAINQALNLAKNLKLKLKKKQQKEYEYRDLGAMATIGTNKAVVDFPLISFHGYFAWLVWMFLHLMLILSARNKIIIFINWAWAYLTKDSSLRLILKDTRKV